MAVVAAGLGLAAVMGHAQTPPRAVGPQLEASLVGRDSFQLYCASCHGVAGRGDGPVASALTNRPSDLTRLTLRNNGAFPRDRVREFIAGNARRPAAHGSTEMPVWGPVFGTFETETRVRVRLDNLVAYMETLQIR